MRSHNVLSDLIVLFASSPATLQSVMYAFSPTSKATGQIHLVRTPTGAMVMKRLKSPLAGEEDRVFS